MEKLFHIQRVAKLINSGEFDGLSSEEAKEAIVNKLEKLTLVR